MTFYMWCGPSFFLSSAYTEAYNVCSLAVGQQTGSVGDVGRETVGEEDQGRTSEEEDGGVDSNYDKQVSSHKCVLNLSRLGTKRFIQHAKTFWRVLYFGIINF